MKKKCFPSIIHHSIILTAIIQEKIRNKILKTIFIDRSQQVDRQSPVGQCLEHLNSRPMYSYTNDREAGHTRKEFFGENAITRIQCELTIARMVETWQSYQACILNHRDGLIRRKIVSLPSQKNRQWYQTLTGRPRMEAY